jgi:hypothetical protein
LSSATGAPAAAGDPAGFQFVGDSTQHVVYRGTDQHIHELWGDAAHGWGHVDLTAVAGTPPAAGDPSGYAFEAQRTQHVLYRGVDRHIYELWWDAASGWAGGSLTGATGASLAAGDPAGYVFTVEATQHVIYRGIDGHIHELWWSASTGWSHGDLTVVSCARLRRATPLDIRSKRRGRSLWSIAAMTTTSTSSGGMQLRDGDMAISPPRLNLSQRREIRSGTCSTTRVPNTWSIATLAATSTSSGGARRTGGRPVISPR